MFILQITHRYDLHIPLTVDCQSMLRSLCNRRMVWHRLGRDVLLLVVLMRIRGWPLLLALTYAVIKSMAHPMVWSVNEAVVRSDPAYQATLNVIRPPIVLGVATLLHMPKYVNLCANDRKKISRQIKQLLSFWKTVHRFSGRWETTCVPKSCEWFVHMRKRLLYFRNEMFNQKRHNQFQCNPIKLQKKDISIGQFSSTITN